MSSRNVESQVLVTLNVPRLLSGYRYRHAGVSDGCANDYFIVSCINAYIYLQLAVGMEEYSLRSDSYFAENFQRKLPSVVHKT